jgi:ribose 5-phosphate isomerase B
MNKKVAIGSDHAGFKLKERIKSQLSSMGFNAIDFGCDSEDSVDYPDYAHPVAASIEKGESVLGIVICGSGNGINMTVNKHQDIRSALCWTVEIAELARLHNDANVLALPARFISEELAEEITHKFLTTNFEGGRHEKRVNKIACC